MFLPLASVLVPFFLVFSPDSVVPRLVPVLRVHFPRVGPGPPSLRFPAWVVSIRLHPPPSYALGAGVWPLLHGLTAVSLDAFPGYCFEIQNGHSAPFLLFVSKISTMKSSCSVGIICHY